jgi:hypothetical protein
MGSAVVFVVAADKEDFCVTLAALYDKCTILVIVAEAADVSNKEKD